MAGTGDYGSHHVVLDNFIGAQRRIQELDQTRHQLKDLHTPHYSKATIDKFATKEANDDPDKMDRILIEDQESIKYVIDQYNALNAQSFPARTPGTIHRLSEDYVKGTS